MTLTVETPRLNDLAEVVATLGEWQHTLGPVQLHPGDLGWFSLRGEAVLATRLRAWRRNGALIALGLLDEPDLLRMAVAPEIDADRDIAAQLVIDLESSAAGVLPPGPAAVEARSGAALGERLRLHGWEPDDPWVPLRRDLTEEVPDAAAELGLSVDVVDDTNAAEWFAVHASAFDGGGGVYWEPLRQSIPFRQGQCLLARDTTGAAVGCIAVWSAGPNRPGLIEPLGVHPDHRRRGYGRALNLAAARTLRSWQASEVTVCAPTSQASTVQAYIKSGFVAEAEVCDFVRRA
ncbi:hypothetical protein GCM10022204_10850 [Microlunatus aurantiacus]|uniref:N-acetyltransferase domain-containing protein n=1 Tax=Microlunatus aurantiacus TaxID=446786 RepID=A0ABP7CV15_9ACTN